MGNPLESMMTSPAAPNPDAGNALQQGSSPQHQQNAPPPPSHAQTVAALRHCDAIKAELKTLLSNPALGKSDLKDPIIDGVTSLVSRRMISAAEAVQELSQVPENPLEQRKFLQAVMMRTIQTERAVLAHHAMGFAGQGPEPTPSADSHMDDLKALRGNYSQK